MVEVEGLSKCGGKVPAKVKAIAEQAEPAWLGDLHKFLSI